MEADRNKQSAKEWANSLKNLRDKEKADKQKQED